MRTQLPQSERRLSPRYPTGPSAFLSLSSIPSRSFLLSDAEGEGVIRNISQNGCQVEAPLRMDIGHRYQVILQLQPTGTPIVIAEAHIRWKSEEIFGLSFDRIDPNQRVLLAWMIEQLRPVSNG